MKHLRSIFVFYFVISLSYATNIAFAQEDKSNEKSLKASSYVSSEACETCHPKEYESFMAVSKKSQTYKVVEKMSASVPAEDMLSCPNCHATGYNKGGFVDKISTPQFKNVGCEACHGPGLAHVESQSSADIAMPTLETCQSCHSDKVKSVNYKPLMFASAH